MGKLAKATRTVFRMMERGVRHAERIRFGLSPEMGQSRVFPGAPSVGDTLTCRLSYVGAGAERGGTGGRCHLRQEKEMHYGT